MLKKLICIQEDCWVGEGRQTCRERCRRVWSDDQMDEALLSQTMEVSTSTSHTRTTEFTDNRTRHSSLSVPRLESGGSLSWNAGIRTSCKSM